MKFLPTYRESQSDWFGKQGLSWHLSIVAQKVDRRLQSQTLVHIIENCLQDTSVVCILEHTLRTIKFEHPEFTSAFLCQDNAGCYHNSVLLVTCNVTSKSPKPVSESAGLTSGTRKVEKQLATGKLPQ